MERFLYEKLDVSREIGAIKEIPNFLKQGLSKRIELREYQKEAFENFITYFENEKLNKNKQIHTLFHMATGSGKTVIMAGLILYLYEKGYRNFLFFVNQTNILEKTKDNFINVLSNKYLFNEDLNYLGEKVKMNVVDNFQRDIFKNNNINICFTTIQKLHLDLFENKENAMTGDDFENNKVVFISDESHHVNTFTKNRTKEEKEIQKSWETSIMNAFYSNKNSILLEFTATADLKDKNVEEKYRDKIIYNYPLKNFRESGYTKDFVNFSINTDTWKRTLIALILSEYRRFLFSDCGQNIKPVIMLKSKVIKESRSFYDEFFEKINKLDSSDFENLPKEDKYLKKALDYFRDKDKNKTFEFLKESIRDSFVEEKAIIINGNEDNNVEKQLLLNSLEDKKNNKRIIFAVDMLNEGWDVLNLFDIVRLYDTRSSASYTIKEAQLIGRGARYCPFLVNEEQEKFKRKYDFDLDNKYRILETMFFHSIDDSKYISELKKALIEIGLQEKNTIERKYILKAEFKNTDFYNHGYVFSNSRIEKTRENIYEIEEDFKYKTFYPKTKNKNAKTENLIDNKNEKNFDNIEIKKMRLNEIDYNILSGTAIYFNELKFNVLKEKYPNLKTLKEFLTGENYLGNIGIEFKYVKGSEITGKDVYRELKQEVFPMICKHINEIKTEYEGREEFEPYKIKDVIKDKTIYLSSISNDGKGESQIKTSSSEFKLDLSVEDWYVYDDNYGTTEEKSFIKYFKNEIKPKLDEKNFEYYVIRNERFSELALYSFDKGERFEPDYLLFIKNKNNDNKSEEYQIYAEPKGEQLLLVDKWKEDFLIKIEEKQKTMKNNHKIIGLPFFNGKGTKLKEFSEAINRFLDKI
ncbi:DEAD/DEAH box helicase family protein [Leptotrichia wadei]|uniref:Type III restriction enzyme, res subunit n=1 Tax=Leptotrichia wadei (strain F0279) TaxID=888055 RepID=U2Q5T6_LEPWF|nr:DEAD/DEAH box helicase family protein [Leptotrichia wadei]ERK51399.1 type III restriction enzyme, res subunit [Leptotrichia wadei F0279]